MKLQTMKNAVTSKTARQILKAQKHSPQLLFVGGVVGITGTVILACRATLKLESVLVEAEKEHANVDEVRGNSRREMARDHAYVNVRTTMEIAKLYAPSVLLGGASIAALTGSHVILNKRNVAMTAAYKAVEEGFERYRERVRDEFGEEKELELRYGTQEYETYQISDKGEKGKIDVIQKIGPQHASIYARFFDELNENWERHPEYNLIFLTNIQRFMNDRLHAKGHLFLNEVYDALGMERSKAGQVVGWVTKPGGDNYVDFGYYNSDNPRARDFVNGREPSILLDFNVDGPILDLI